MEDKELVQGQLGTVGEYDLKFEGGALKAEVKAAVGPATVGVEIALDAGKVIDALEKAIPGQLDDAVLELLRAALVKKPA